MTLAELARLAGVSRTTASYVMNGQGAARRIKPETIERVLALARAHNFQVDAQAAALRGGASRTLGFILPDLDYIAKEQSETLVWWNQSFKA